MNFGASVRYWTLARVTQVNANVCASRRPQFLRGRIDLAPRSRDFTNGMNNQESTHESSALEFLLLLLLLHLRERQLLRIEYNVYMAISWFICQWSIRYEGAELSEEAAAVCKGVAHWYTDERIPVKQRPWHNIKQSSREFANFRKLMDRH